MIQLVIFDVWNTLLYNPGDHKDQIAKLLGMTNKELRAKKKEWCIQKISAKEFFSQFTQNKDVLNEVLELWDELNENVAVFSDVEEVLKNLKSRKLKLVLLSNATSYTKEILGKKNLLKYFDRIYLSCDYALTKPDVRLFKKILEDFNLSPNQIAMVGDKEDVDLIQAKEIGMCAILLDRRCEKTRTLADHTVNSMENLQKII